MRALEAAESKVRNLAKGRNAHERIEYSWFKLFILKRPLIARNLSASGNVRESTIGFIVWWTRHHEVYASVRKAGQYFYIVTTNNAP